MLSRTLLAAAASIGGFAVGSTARATLFLNVDHGATTVVDNGPGDADPATGRISSTVSEAGYPVVINLTSSNSPGSSTVGLLQLNSLSVQNGPNPATLDIQISDTGYTAPGVGGQPMSLQSTLTGSFIQGSLGNTASIQSFADPANAQPASVVSTPMLTFTKSLPLTTEPFSGTNEVSWVRGSGPYSLTQEVSVTLSGNAQIQLTGTTNASAAVPEPATLGLLALGAAVVCSRRCRHSGN